MVSKPPQPWPPPAATFSPPCPSSSAAAACSHLLPPSLPPFPPTNAVRSFPEQNQKKKRGALVLLPSLPFFCPADRPAPARHTSATAPPIRSTSSAPPPSSRSCEAYFGRLKPSNRKASGPPSPPPMTFPSPKPRRTRSKPSSSPSCSKFPAASNSSSPRPSLTSVPTNSYRPHPPRSPLLGSLLMLPSPPVSHLSFSLQLEQNTASRLRTTTGKTDHHEIAGVLKSLAWSASLPPPATISSWPSSASKTTRVSAPSTSLLTVTASLDVPAHCVFHLSAGR